MAGSGFGRLFRVTTAGESHSRGNVVIIDGCPPGLALCEADFAEDLGRRRPGQSAIVTERNESDVPEILSGVLDGRTTGTSLAILVRNDDARSKDYDKLARVFRPGHGDFTYAAKYGVRDHRGGGRSSARETVARVTAGVVAKRILAEHWGARVLAWVKQVGDVVAEIAVPEGVTIDAVERLPDGTPNVVRCPDPAKAKAMCELIERVRSEKDSIGGVAEIVAVDIPSGFGEPVFDKLEADLAKALFSIPAVVGVEVGAGFSVATKRGSENNDLFFMDGSTVRTRTNHHGGILGGISSGMPILLRAAVKPASSVPREQETVDVEGNATSVIVRGRHDPCLLPRFVPVAEAMVAIVLADHGLRWRAQCGAR